MRRAPLRAAATLVLLSLTGGALVAQTTPGSGERAEEIGWLPSITPVTAPYAGRYEARVGGSRESANDQLRLDIGAAVDLLANPRTTIFGVGATGGLVLGADFFTWTRLRSAGGFRFPVEAVDYYFGVRGAIGFGDLHLRLRLAHISAHLVDGDRRFGDTSFAYMTYSREFVDLLVGLPLRSPSGVIRPYATLTWLFHTIPDSLGRIAPGLGVDVTGELLRGSFPLTLVAGGELVMNTELETGLDHRLRLGVKFGHPFTRGLLLEGGHSGGRSPYGQLYWQEESYWWLGFGISF